MGQPIQINARQYMELLALQERQAEAERPKPMSAGGRATIPPARPVSTGSGMARPLSPEEGRRLLRAWMFGWWVGGPLAYLITLIAVLKLFSVLGPWIFGF